MLYMKYSTACITLATILSHYTYCKRQYIKDYSLSVWNVETVS